MLLSYWSVVTGERHHVFVFDSLALHPDKIRIATGQIAGVDKDGRVRTNILFPLKVKASSTTKT